MTKYELDLVYKEGIQWYRDGLYCTDNPYYGVSQDLADSFDNGWWDAWYGDN